MNTHFNFTDWTFHFASSVTFFCFYQGEFVMWKLVQFSDKNQACMSTPNLTPTHNHNGRISKSYENTQIIDCTQSYEFTTNLPKCKVVANWHEDMLEQNTILFINTCSVAHHLYADQSLCFSWMYFIELKTWTITIYVHIFHCNYFKCKLRSSNLTVIWNMSLSFLCFCHLESTNLLSYSMGDFNHKHLRVT